ncbi:MAG TPA: DUF6282 family protein [Dehalococcoidia bacterium]|nr:DUF6282 family protein [Dehalococcoidia bacterium]
MTTVEDRTGTEEAFGDIPRYLSSYRARRAYREAVQEPPFVKGIEDTIDIHCHAHEGQQHPLAIAKLASQAGMRGLLYKSITGGNRGPAGSVRKLLEELNPWCEANGVRPIKAWAGFGIARGAGIIPPDEVRKEIEDGVRCVWMPIANSATTLHKIGGWTSMWDKTATTRIHSDPLPWDFALKVGMYTLEEDGKLKAPIREIFKMVADFDIAVSFAHASHPEIYAMAEEVKRLGIKRAFVDHPFSPFVDLSLAQMKELTSAGIYMNFTYDELSPLLGIDPARMAHAIKTLGTSKVTISTDAGEPLFPNSIECMRLIRGHLRAFGLNEDQIHEMSVTNPAKIVGLAEA